MTNAFSLPSGNSNSSPSEFCSSDKSQLRVAFQSFGALASLRLRSSKPLLPLSERSDPNAVVDQLPSYSQEAVASGKSLLSLQSVQLSAWNHLWDSTPTAVEEIAVDFPVREVKANDCVIGDNYGDNSNQQSDKSPHPATTTRQLATSEIFEHRPRPRPSESMRVGGQR